MRLPKHKLPKEASKHSKQTKHKKATLKAIRRTENTEKKSKMSTEATEDEKDDGVDDEGTVASVISAADKWAAKLERKKANAHKIQYKKLNYSITGKNGPRAVSR